MDFSTGALIFKQDREVPVKKRTSVTEKEYVFSPLKAIRKLSVWALVGLLSWLVLFILVLIAFEIIL